MKHQSTLIIALLSAGTVTVQAADPGNQSAFQLSLTPDIAIHKRDTAIHGFSLGIWSENPQKSLTLGIVNGSTGESVGFTWSFLANYAESYTGVAWSLVNYSKTSFVGWQGGAVNIAQGEFTGFQSGFVNYAEKAKGLQWGAVNYAEDLHGVQIGFINIAMNNPWFTEFPNKLATGFPIVNWSF
ncbi:MAG TPA: hypothetical protein PKA41_10910 [Verrucomicrobiota bacterium]|nr:hypothetical protein [Verrucomicrobiota bacterium]